MRHLLFFFALIFLVAGTTSANVALVADSAQQVNVPSIVRSVSYESVRNGEETKMISPDTLLDDFEIANPATKYFHNYLGNLGSASSSKIFNSETGLLTNFGNHSLDLYKTTPAQIRFYKTNKRFSELNYTQGSGKEQRISLGMAQNITNNWSIGFDFARLGSLGYMANEKSFHTNFDVFTWLHTKDKRYQVFASALWNSLTNKLNGGLASDSIFKNTSVSNSEIAGLGTNISGGALHWRNHVFSLLHFFDTSTKEDSSSGNIFSTRLRFQHELQFESASNIYSDNSVDSSFYTNYFFNDSTSDSLHYYQFTNRFSVNTLPQGGYLNMGITAGHQWFSFKQYSSDYFLADTSLENIFAGGSISAKQKSFFPEWIAKGEFIVDGENKNDYTLDGLVKEDLKSAGIISFAYSKTLHAPSLMQSFYLSNHFIRETLFDNIQTDCIRVNYSLAKYHVELGAANTSITNQIYFDTTASPIQSNKMLQVMQVYFKKDFRYGKMHFNNTVWWQQTNRSAVISLPDFTSHHSLYYESWMFKNTLFAQMGVDAHFTSEYFADAYLPAQNIFYRNQSVKTNGYPLVDVFFNFKIKTARLFIKVQNIGDGIISDGYFLTPHYPMPGRTFQFGLSWKFFD